MPWPSLFALRPRASLWIGLLLALPLPISPGCTSPRLATTQIEIARGIRFDLLPPESFGRALSLAQRIEAQRGDETRSFDCLLEIDAQELVLVGLTPFGSRAFVLALAGHDLRVENSSGGELPADPARILADLQLALWPSLPPIGEIGAGIDVVERHDVTGAPVRELLHDGRPVIRITYESSVRWQGVLRLEHLEQGYTLVVRTLRAEELGELGELGELDR